MPSKCLWRLVLDAGVLIAVLEMPRKHYRFQLVNQVLRKLLYALIVLNPAALKVLF